jgi:hypothetical protein
MAISNAESELIRIVQQQINSGSRRVFLPGHLVNAASEAVLDEIRRLCKLNGVAVEVRM